MARISAGAEITDLSIDRQPFSEHVKELRKRVLFVALSILAGSAGAYAIQNKLVEWLLRPAKGQHFIYTSPGGGIDFSFKVCLYAGIAVAIPIIVYNFLRYVEPAFPKRSIKYIYWGTAVSGLLAFIGLAFGYFVGLPSAMTFLLNQTLNHQIQPLLTVQSYMSFIIRYLLGSAMILQLPLIIIFINRIKPLKPKMLLRYERWVILLSLIISMLMNPTPKIVDQLIIAGPMILMYQLSILIVIIVNRGRESAKVEAPAAQDSVRAYVKPGLRHNGIISDFL